MLRPNRPAMSSSSILANTSDFNLTCNSNKGNGAKILTYFPAVRTAPSTAVNYVLMVHVGEACTCQDGELNQDLGIIKLTLFPTPTWRNSVPCRRLRRGMHWVGHGPGQQSNNAARTRGMLI